jgi:putative methanogen marker protein 4
MISMLMKGEVDAAVRGTLSATKVIAEVRRQFKVDEMLRIALLTTASGTSFFLAPVGVDEGETLEEKVRLIEAGIVLHNRLGVTPKVSILSGGRMEDWGRSKFVDNSLRNGEKLASLMVERGVFEVKHHGILVEEAVNEGYTLIIAPSGISGNLLFRALVFLGGGKAIGAPYMGVPKPLVDVSRAMSDVSDAIALASALTKP